MSKYGRVSELAGRLRIASGFVAATEASFFRKGSLGLSGGMGILALLLLLSEHMALKLRRLREAEEDDEHGSVDAMGNRKAVAMGWF